MSSVFYSWIERAAESADGREQADFVKQFLLGWFQQLTAKDPVSFQGLYGKMRYLAQKTRLPSAVSKQLHAIRIAISNRTTQKSNIPLSPDAFLFLSQLDTLWSEGKWPEKWILWETELPQLSSSLPQLHVHVTDVSEEGLTLEDTLSGSILQLNWADQEDDLYVFVEVGMSLELIQVERMEGDAFRVRVAFFVLEPNYMMDVTAIAECFKSFGVHSSFYFWNRFAPSDLGLPILIGHAANLFLDEHIQLLEQTSGARSAIQRAFRAMPLLFASRHELDEPGKMSEFIQELESQWEHIRALVNSTLKFPEFGILPDRVMIEPAFVSKTYGLQGRMDVFQPPFKGSKKAHILELKSGKSPWPHQVGHLVARNHHAQAAMYVYMARLVYPGSSNTLNAYIFYSKYAEDHLRFISATRQQLQDIMHLRNQVVGGLYQTAFQPPSDSYPRWLDDLQSARFSGEKMSEKFKDIILQQWNRFKAGFYQAPPIRICFFNTWHGFLQRELWHQKKENASLAYDRQADKELLTDCVIIENRCADENPTVLLTLPEEQIGQHSFREGDLVQLYKDTKDSFENYQVFKASLQKLRDNTLLLTLRNRQKQTDVLDINARWRIEQESADYAYPHLFRGLYDLLKWENIYFDKFILSKSWERTEARPCSDIPSEFSALWEKVSAAQDYFLIQGPPGTGKTSRCLRALTQGFLEVTDGAVFLMAFTNRAVDEICDMLCQAGLENFIRLGSSQSVPPMYHSKMLDQVLSGFTKRKEVLEKLQECRIYIGTVFSFIMKPELLPLLKVSVSLLDEASQVLEPQLLPLLVKQNEQGQAYIPKWVLIGDPMQLPAVVTQSESWRKAIPSLIQEMGYSDLSLSLFERMWNRLDEAHKANYTYILSEQGRMHPEIARYPSQQFYHGALTIPNPPLPHQEGDLSDVWGENLKFSEKLRKCRVLFFHIEEPPGSKDQKMKSNLTEAYWVSKLAKGLDASDCSVGIMAPFRQQLTAIRNALLLENVQKDILIDTVERFQGGQRDVIIISLTVHSPGQALQLSNISEDQNVDRKLNVMLTRAKRQCIVIGNKHILSHNPHYAHWIEQVEEGEFVV